MNTSSVTDILETLRQGFLDDLPSRIDLIEDNVLAVQNDDSVNDELFRIVHSLKGSAGSYNFHIITSITHHMEDVMLFYVKQNTFNTNATTQRLLEYVDILKNAYNIICSGDASFESVEKQLSHLQTQVFNKAREVLIVEPSKLYASIIEHSLSNMSVKMTVVSDGFKALEHLLIQKYDLLITAMETPPLNADALVSALRLTHNYNRQMPVVLLTSTDKEKIKTKDAFNLIINRSSVREESFSNRINEFIK